MSFRLVSRRLKELLPLKFNTKIDFILNFHCQSHPCRAGHSKWANIRHIKALKDGEKATIFTKLARQIRLAVQEGGSPDPSKNSNLRGVVDEALRKNMPMSTIQSNIKKSQQNKNELKRHHVQIRYKQKVFAVCILYTENFTQLKMEMAPIVRKAGAKFVEVPHLFEDKGVIDAFFNITKLSGTDLEERITEDAIECGAEEVEVIASEEGRVNFVCNIMEMPAVRRKLELKEYKITSTDHVFIPIKVVELTPEECNAYNIFLQKLRNLPGVEDIYDNVETLELT